MKRIIIPRRKFLITSALGIVSAPAILRAQVPMTGAGLGKPSSGGGNSLTLTASPAGQGSGTSQTFTAQSIGAAVASRIVIVCVEIKTSGTPTTTGWTLSLTGGSAISAVNLMDAGGAGVGIYYASVPTGTTSDITVSTTGGTLPNINGVQIAVYSMIGLSGAPTSTGSTAWVTTFSTMIVNATVTNFGVVVFGTDRALAPTWSNATQDFHQNFATTGDDIFTLHTSTAGSQTPTSSTVTTNYDAAMACW